MEPNEKPLVKIASDVIDILWAGILWLVLSLPIITIGPASCALYYTVVKVVRRKRETVVRAFFYSFRQNLRQGIAVTIIYAAWIGMIAVIIRGYLEGAVWFLNGYVLMTLLVLTGVPLLFTIVYIIPVISRFSMKLGGQFQIALILSIRKLPYTVYLIFLMGLAALILYRFTSWIFVVPGFYALISSFIVEKILVDYMKSEKNRFHQVDEDAWYMEE